MQHTLLQQPTLKKVLSCLDYTTLRTMCSVCKACRDMGYEPALWANFNNWADIPGSEPPLSKILLHPRFSQLQVLRIDKSEIDINVVLERLFHPQSPLIMSLRTLDISYSAATSCPFLQDSGMAFIARAIRLTQLNINRYNKLTDAGLASISNLMELTSLNISHLYDVTDQGIASMSRLRALQYLNMGHCPRISDAGLNTLAHFTDLQYLNMEWCIKVGSSGLPFLQRMPKLQSLNVAMCMHVNDLCLQNMSLITSLQYLNLSDCHNISLQGIINIAKLPKLQYINLSRCPLADSFLPYIVRIPHLQVLKIAGCKGLTKEAVHSILVPKIGNLVYY
jgi:Leucine-rich repeat (LRR) protein